MWYRTYITLGHFFNNKKSWYLANNNVNIINQGSMLGTEVMEFIWYAQSTCFIYVFFDVKKVDFKDEN